MIADLGAVREGIGDVRHEGALLGTNLAPLYAKASVNAMRAVAVGAGKNGHGPADTDADPKPYAATNEYAADLANRVRTICIKEADRGHLVQPRKDYVASRLFPEILLAEDAVARVIARLRFGRDGIARFGVHRPSIGMLVFSGH